MKRWPLRWKISVYAAGFGVVATISAAATTWTIMRGWEIAAFDRRLALDAQELFRDIANFEGGWQNNRRAFKEKFVPLALKDRLVEVLGPDGELLYASPGLDAPVFDDGIEKIHTRKIGDRSVRMGTFHQGDVTARVGADLREINQIGH